MADTPKKLLPEREWQLSLPSKRISAQLIIRDEAGRFLLVKPNYRDYWILPGGVVEADESPEAAMRREILEEINVELKNMRFIGIDYSEMRQHDLPDWLHVLFTADTLTADVIRQMVPEEDEIDDIAFMDKAEYEERAHESVVARLNTVARAPGPYNLLNGSQI